MLSSDKKSWSGCVVAVQPRIRLMRSFNQRSHSYLGYVLRIDGTCGVQTGEFLIAVGEGAHEKHLFQTGMVIEEQSVRVVDPRKETADFYKTSGIKLIKAAEGDGPGGPPILSVPPDLETYRSRGHRRLDTRTYDAKCTACIWGCRMPVEMIIDRWNPSKSSTGSKPSVTGRKVALFIGLDPPGKSRGEKVCPTPRRTGSMKTTLLTEGQTIEGREVTTHVSKSS